MTENFSNTAKETDIQVQEAQSSKQDVPKEAHNNKKNYITVPKDKDKEIILKAAKEKAPTYV